MTRALQWAVPTTISYVHRGVVLPEARVVVIVVPLAILGGFWWLVHRRGNPGG